MEPDNVERNLQSLRRLYCLLDLNARNESIPEPYLLDENTQFLLKRLLDFASHELFVTQSKILATQLGLFPRTDLHSAKPSTVADSSVTMPPPMSSQVTRISKPLEVKGALRRDLRVDQIQSNPSKDGLTEEVADAIEQIDTQLSALSFVSSRVDSDDRTGSCKSSVTPPIEEQKCEWWCRCNSSKP
ncbi:hypothetical protein ARALYDRAFT_919668 [Arabidopsis lyrata subsp. lyrata]|uniref:Uncharacterized protein n=1 Tax=Arabidopsis lyrata subsp. lyrata TaxID=81972 RepID=D7MPS1_ARALL|nr:hypothetical protein ARALYDRAFT_919668 [Arabidopsis lyrata subsp. lyrata]